MTGTPRRTAGTNWCFDCGSRLSYENLSLDHVATFSDPQAISLFKCVNCMLDGYKWPGTKRELMIVRTLADRGVVRAGVGVGSPLAAPPVSMDFIVKGKEESTRQAISKAVDNLVQKPALATHIRRRLVYDGNDYHKFEWVVGHWKPGRYTACRCKLL